MVSLPSLSGLVSGHRLAPFVDPRLIFVLWLYCRKDKPVVTYNPSSLVRRWLSTVGVRFETHFSTAADFSSSTLISIVSYRQISLVFGGAVGGMASYSAAKDEADALASQSGLTQRTMPGLQQYRLTLQRAVARGVLRGASKVRCGPAKSACMRLF